MTAVGVPELDFHGLRHTGNTFAAKTGASLRDLMARMGHDSTRAALIYQHASSEADRAIAAALNDLVSERQEGKKKRKRKRARRRPEGVPGGERGPDDGDDGAAGVLVPAS